MLLELLYGAFWVVATLLLYVFFIFGIPLILSFIVLYLIELLHENDFVTEKGVEESSNYVLFLIFVAWLIFLLVFR